MCGGSGFKKIPQELFERFKSLAGSEVFLKIAWDFRDLAKRSGQERKISLFGTDIPRTSGGHSHDIPAQNFGQVGVDPGEKQASRRGHP